MWNTVTVQYNPMIEEEFDEHFKVTCEYGYDFWKTVTFPFLDVEWVPHSCWITLTFVFPFLWHPERKTFVVIFKIPIESPKRLFIYFFRSVSLLLFFTILLSIRSRNVCVYDFRVATGNPVVFTLQPPECYMEIRYGYGTTGTRVAGPVRVGDPLTLIIYMRSKYGHY